MDIVVKDYNLSVLNHMGKANVMADAFILLSMGSVAHIDQNKKELAHEVYKFARLDLD